MPVHNARLPPTKIHGEVAARSPITMQGAIGCSQRFLPIVLPSRSVRPRRSLTKCIFLLAFFFSYQQPTAVNHDNLADAITLLHKE